MSRFRLFLAVFLLVPAFALADTPRTAAKKTLMTRALDARLNRIKRSDPAEFRRELATQKDFNASTKEFCEYYRSQCQGSACPACVETCYASLYDFRAEQARKMGSKSLELGVPGGKPGTPYAEKFFKAFSENVCQLPASLWKSGNVPSACPELQLKEMDSRLIAGLVANPSSDGDVCAQLSQAGPAASGSDMPAQSGMQILMAPAVAPTIPVCAGEPALPSGRIKDLEAARAGSLQQDPWLAWVAQTSAGMVSCKTTIAKRTSDLELNVNFGNGNRWSAAIESGGTLKWVKVDFDKHLPPAQAKAQAVRTAAAGIHGVCTPIWDNPPGTLTCTEQKDYQVMLQFDDQGQVLKLSVTPKIASLVPADGNTKAPEGFDSNYTSKNGFITVSFPSTFAAKTVGKSVVAVIRKTPGAEEVLTLLSLIPKDRELSALAKTLNAAETPKLHQYTEISQKPAICSGQPGIEILGKWTGVKKPITFMRSACIFLRNGRGFQFAYSIASDLAPQDEPILRKIRDAVRFNP